VSQITTDMFWWS